MAFYGCEFVFDDISSAEFGLMMYDVNSINEDGKFATGGKIVETRTAWRHTPLHYGVTRNEPMSFKITFGIDLERIDWEDYLTRDEMEKIATWLTDNDDYKKLEIIQDDMLGVYYKCFITDLSYKTYGKYPMSFEATVTCDSPYAYYTPQISEHNISGTLNTSIRSWASSKYYRPKLIITSSSQSANNSITITNHSDEDRQFQITGIPAGNVVITVDNENEVITNNQSLNLYGNLTGFKFFRLVRGINNLTFSGSNISVKIVCDFPVNVGG